MARMALYRSWRPRRFDELVGQEAASETLRQAIQADEIAHAYLFCGTRGTGKTSMAKILARAVNCLHPQDGNPCNSCELCQAALEGTLLDIQEIDAASNNSVDNIRRLIDEVQYLPARAKYKVYIIDEVHMLSTGAFNALLKTLEEPPKHVIFILATTEVQRIPATIRSRCQRFDFRRISSELMQKRLREIALSEGIRISDACLAEIAARSDGALRDAISLLDQCQMSFPEGCEQEDLLRLLGSMDSAFFLDLAQQLIELNAAGLMAALDRVQAEGRDLGVFCTEAAGFFRDLLLAHEVGGETELLRIPEAEKELFYGLARRYSSTALQFCLRRLQQLLADMKWAPQKRICVDLAFLSMLASFKEQQRRQRGGRSEGMAANKTGPDRVAAVSPDRPPAAQEAVVGPSSAVELSPPSSVTESEARTFVAGQPQTSELPVEETPADEAPDQELPIQERPVQESPVQESLDQDAPEEAPAERSPALGDLSSDAAPGAPASPSASPPEPAGEGAGSLAEALAQVAREQSAQTLVPASQVGQNLDSDSQQTPGAGRPRLRSRAQIRALWTEFQAKLEQEDSYTYFMLRKGRVRVEGGKIRIHYGAEEANSYRALQEPRLQQSLLRSWRPYELQTGLALELLGPSQEEDPDLPQTETDWQERIRTVTRDLDIPVEELD